MKTKSVISNFFCYIRNWRSKPLFESLGHYCTGSVLDVGGWDFYQTVINAGVQFNDWVVLEVSKDRIIPTENSKVTFVVGDGCHMEFANETFDTILNIQVLEHVYEPILMMKEMTRVLKTGGYMILLVPQTSAIHMAPHHYYNFTRFWIERVTGDLGLEICVLKHIGGVWSTFASRLFYFYFQAFRFPGMSYKECKRKPIFYFLLPFMCLFAAAAIPVCMFFSLGDLIEEPNNYLVVARKK